MTVSPWASDAVELARLLQVVVDLARTEHHLLDGVLRVDRLALGRPGALADDAVEARALGLQRMSHGVNRYVRDGIFWGALR
jgi:hypothetical protein